MIKQNGDKKFVYSLYKQHFIEKMRFKKFTTPPIHTSAIFLTLLNNHKKIIFSKKITCIWEIFTYLMARKE